MIRALVQYACRHGRRIAVTLLPVVLGWLHTTGHVPLDLVRRFDDILYDLRLRHFMPRTLDERVVIVDVDEKSLAEVGRWPWGRHRLAQLVDELFDRQGVALLGFDVVFAEPDESSGLAQMQKLAEGPLRNVQAYQDALKALAPEIDHDRRFAASLQGRPVVLGYYLTSDREGRTSGRLPAPVFEPDVLAGRPFGASQWSGYGSNLAVLAEAAPMAGFVNAIPEIDGVVRSTPLIAEHNGRYYESLALAMFRSLLQGASVSPGFVETDGATPDKALLTSINLLKDRRLLPIPVDERAAALVPFRGPGGVSGGSYRYVSAADLLAGRLAPQTLKDRIVLVGTTAPGLVDLRVTPVEAVYPGVEAHANVLSGLLDGTLLVRPDFAGNYEVTLLVLAGLTLAFWLPRLTAGRAVLLSAAMFLALCGLNFWLYLGEGLVLPLAASLLVVVTAFALNMSYGYFVESRSKRDLAGLFGTYVPPELVDVMVQNPENYSMHAANRDLTVMFCDMRGFTKMSEFMEPTQLQALLNDVFTRLTRVIRAHQGTIDKYMGDCVMAFWGAPVETAEHAVRAVETATEMVQAIEAFNAEGQKRGLPSIGIGIGLNTGLMCVGDMGSDIRRSYTVIGDAVNLGSRLEGLSKIYGVAIVASESCRSAAPHFLWQELDRVRVKGKDTAVHIFTPRSPASDLSDELQCWERCLHAWRRQDWQACGEELRHLSRNWPQCALYSLYAERLESARLRPFDPAWDGATDFETK